MPLGERIRRTFERWFMPWFSRDEAERAMAHSEELRQTSIATRKEAEKVIATVTSTTNLRNDYRRAAMRLRR